MWGKPEQINKAVSVSRPKIRPRCKPKREQKRLRTQTKKEKNSKRNWESNSVKLSAFMNPAGRIRFTAATLWVWVREAGEVSHLRKFRLAEKTGPRDVFLQFLSVMPLYVAAGSFITLIFQYINYWIPDPLEAGYGYISSIFNSIRWAISILIVIFPVYAWTLWFIDKGYKEVPERMAMKSRKWLVYLTIFLAALLIIGDFVALVYLLLRGEFTARFLLKVLTIILVA